MTNRFLFASACFFICACNGPVINNDAGSASEGQQSAKSTTKKSSLETVAPDNDAAITAGSPGLNEITVLEKGGLDVARAYLSFEDGSLVPRTHQVELGQTVYLNLIIDKGWDAQDGAVSIDASERIEAADGRLVLNAPNLFKSMPLIAEDKAAHLLLKAVITRTSPAIPYFVVNYHVWDKRGSGEATGNYKLYVKQANKKD
jgi:hypothetical protein